MIITQSYSSIAAELTVKASMQSDEKKVKKMVERRKKSKGKERVAAEMPITYRKKNDGKGWRCKRPAQLPHTFCSYHLAQTRSYSSNHRAIDHALETTTVDNNQNQEIASTGGDSNNFYYYYHGFGLWRGKRRGRAATVNAKVEEEVAEDGSRKSMDCDDDDNVVAGDDEYGLDCFDEDDYDDNDCYNMPHQDHPHEENGKKNEGELERKRVAKKRGRKPLKSRSLKSLL